MWRPYVRRFGGVAIDRPGALGRSDGPGSLEEDLARIDPAHASVLVGHSFGGLVALRWALDHPDDTTLVVAHEPVLWPLLLGRPPDLSRLGVPNADRFLDERVAGSEPWLSMFVDFWNGPGAWSRMPELVRRAAIAAGATTWREVWHACHDPVPDHAWRQLKVPVRLTVGRDSPPAEHRVIERLAALLPDVEVVRVAGGHTAPLTHSEDLIRAWSRWIVAD